MPTTTTEGWTRANALRVRCKPWAMYGMAVNLVHVDRDGAVWVYDDCACHYVRNHSLSPRSMARIRYLYRQRRA